MVSGPGTGEGHRRSRWKDTSRKTSAGRRKTEQGAANIRPQDGEWPGDRRAGTAQVPRKDNRERGQRSEWWEEEPDTGQAGTAGEDEPHGPQGRGTGRSGQTEKRKRRNTRYFLPRRPPLSVLHAGGEYLGVVANIIAQADEAGFELLGTQRAGVVLGPPCVRQRAMRCQGGGGREGRGGPCPGEGGV